MLAGHRWKRDYAFSGYRCVPLPIGGVESHQWCVGCGCFIRDIELCDTGIPSEGVGGIILDTLAHSKGYKPIESGTYAEYKLSNESNH